MLAVFIFSLAYLGIALGKIPGLVIDRVGVALLGAVAMVIFGVVTLEGAVQSIHLPTILIFPRTRGLKIYTKTPRRLTYARDERFTFPRYHPVW